MLGEQKNVADDVINFLKTKEGKPTLIDEIILTVEKKIHSQPDIRYAIIMLRHKGFIEYTHDKHYCFLTGKGWLYEDYDKVLAEEEYQRTLVEKERKSVIDTNKSVENTNAAIQKNIPIQNRQTRISIWVGVFSAIFILITVYQTCTDATSKELKGIKEELQELRKAQKSPILNPVQRPVSNPKDKGRDSTSK